MQDLGHPGQERHEHRRGRVAGIAAGNEHRVQPGQLAEDVVPFLEGRGDRRGIGIVPVHRRIPDPDVEAVVVEQARHADHHLEWRAGKVGALGVVVRPRRNQLDRVGAEDRQVADVPFPLGKVPAVVGVGLGPVAKLVAAERIPRGGLELELGGQQDAALGRPQFAEQPADAEEHAAGVVARDQHGRALRLGANAIALGGSRPGPVPEESGERTGEGLGGRGRPDGDDGNRLGRPAREHLPADPGPSRHILDQQLDGLSLRTGQ